MNGHARPSKTTERVQLRVQIAQTVSLQAFADKNYEESCSCGGCASLPVCCVHFKKVVRHIETRWQDWIKPWQQTSRWELQHGPPICIPTVTQQLDGAEALYDDGKLVKLIQPILNHRKPGRPDSTPAQADSKREKSFMESILPGDAAGASAREVMSDGVHGKNKGGKHTLKQCRRCKRAGRDANHSGKKCMANASKDSDKKIKSRKRKQMIESDSGSQEPLEATSIQKPSKPIVGKPLEATSIQKPSKPIVESPTANRAQRRAALKEDRAKLPRVETDAALLEDIAEGPDSDETEVETVASQSSRAVPAEESKPAEKSNDSNSFLEQFKVLGLQRVEVCGDGRCWRYAVMACVGLLKHSGSEVADEVDIVLADLILDEMKLRASTSRILQRNPEPITTINNYTYRSHGNVMALHVLAHVLEKHILVVEKHMLEFGVSSHEHLNERHTGWQLMRGHRKLDQDIRSEEALKLLQSDDPPILIEFDGVNHFWAQVPKTFHEYPTWLGRLATQAAATVTRLTKKNPTFKPHRVSARIASQS